MATTTDRSPVNEYTIGTRTDAEQPSIDHYLERARIAKAARVTIVEWTLNRLTTNLEGLVFTVVEARGA